jgi:hypothetical protein
VHAEGANGGEVRWRRSRGRFNRVEEEGEEARKAVGGGARRGRRRSSPGHHRRRRLEATGHRLRHGLDREQEGDSAKLTSCSMTAVRRCRRHAATRRGRDHGCPLGRGVAASAACSWAWRWGPGGPTRQREKEKGESRTDSGRRWRRQSASPRRQ